MIDPIIRLERISTLKNAGTVTIFRNGSVHYDSHIRLTVGQIMICLKNCLKKNVKKVTSGTCFMSFTNYPMDEQLCRVLSVSHSNSIHEVDNMTNYLNLASRSCCEVRYRTTQSSNDPCSTSSS